MPRNMMLKRKLCKPMPQNLSRLQVFLRNKEIARYHVQMRSLMALLMN